MKKNLFILMFVFVSALLSLVAPLDVYADFSEAQCVAFKRAFDLKKPWYYSTEFDLVDGFEWTSTGITQKIIHGGRYRWTYFPYSVYYNDCNPGWKKQ